MCVFRAERVAFSIVAIAEGKQLLAPVDDRATTAGEDENDLGRGLVPVQTDRAARLQPAVQNAVQPVVGHFGVALVIVGVYVLAEALGSISNNHFSLTNRSNVSAAKRSVLSSACT